MHEILRDFFHAIQGGTNSFTSFIKTWSSLNDTVRTNPGSLEEGTLHSLHDSASIIGIVAADIMQLQIDSEKIGKEVMADVSKIIIQDMADLSIDDGLSSTKRLKVPAYVKPAYEWLLSNLHNPYPSKKVKSDISRRTESPMKDIEAWFVDSRKRIGWNKLRKTSFANKQETIVAAATHYFKPKSSSFSDDLTISLHASTDSYDKYRADFAIIANTARTLYADKFPNMVASPSFKHGIESRVSIAPSRDTRTIKEHSQFIAQPPQPIEDHTCPYPTPEPSPSYLSDDLSTPSASHECQIITSFITNASSRKRRFSSSNFCTPDADDSYSRSLKRPRVDLSQEMAIASDGMSCLPSPYTNEPSEDTEEGRTSVSLVQLPSVKRKRSFSDQEMPKPAKHPHIWKPSEVVSNTAIISTPSLPTRKRRLSDADNQRPLKRPHNAFARPRLQTVSDPFPVANPHFERLLDTPHQEDVVELARAFNEIRSQAIPEDIPSLTTPPDVCHGLYHISTHPDPFGQDYLHYLVNAVPEEPPAAIYSPEDTNLLSDYVDPSFCLDILQTVAYPSNIIVSTTDFPDLSDRLPELDFDLSVPIHFNTFNEEFSQWFPRMQSAKSSGIFGSSDSISYKNSNDCATNIESTDAKKARLEALRAQVSHLEGQLADQLTA